jgi:uncharacterized membrane protein (Fun14 family)
MGSGAVLGFVYGRLQPEIEQLTWNADYSPEIVTGGILTESMIASSINTILVEGARASSKVHALLNKSGATMFIEEVIGYEKLNTHAYPIAERAKGVTTFAASFITGFTVGYYLGASFRYLDEHFEKWSL